MWRLLAVSSAARNAGLSQGAMSGGELAVEQLPLIAQCLVFVFELADSGE